MVVKKELRQAGQTGAPIILDIRRGDVEYSNIIVDEVRRGLNPPDGSERTLPTLLLYDQKGLKLFEEIMDLDQYYLTKSEIEVLEENADKMSEIIRPGSMVVELGSGSGSTTERRTASD